MLYEASGEQWTLTDARPWRVSTSVTEVLHPTDPNDPNPGASLPITTSTLGQSMTQALDRIAGHLTYDIPHAQYLLPEALQVHADRLCVPRQVAVILSRDLESVCDAFDEVVAAIYPEETPFIGGWRQEGCTPRMLLELARMWSCNCLILSGSKSLQKYRCENPEALLVASW